VQPLVFQNEQFEAIRQYWEAYPGEYHEVDVDLKLPYPTAIKSKFEVLPTNIKVKEYKLSDQKGQWDRPGTSGGGRGQSQSRGSHSTKGFP